MMKKYRNSSLLTTSEDTIIQRLIAAKYRERTKTEQYLEREVTMKHHPSSICDQQKKTQLSKNKVYQELLSPIRLSKFSKFSKLYNIQKSTSQKIKIAKQNLTAKQSRKQPLSQQKMAFKKQYNQQIQSNKEQMMRQIQFFSGSNSTLQSGRKDLKNIEILKKLKNIETAVQNHINNLYNASSLQKNQKIHQKIIKQQSFQRYQNKLSCYDAKQYSRKIEKLSLPNIKQISLSTKPTQQVKFSDSKQKIIKIKNKRQLICNKQKQFLYGWQSETFYGQPKEVSLSMNISNKNAN